MTRIYFVNERCNSQFRGEVRGREGDELTFQRENIKLEPGRVHWLNNIQFDALCRDQPGPLPIIDIRLVFFIPTCQPTQISVRRQTVSDIRVSNSKGVCSLQCCIQLQYSTIYPQYLVAVRKTSNNSVETETYRGIWNMKPNSSRTRPEILEILLLVCVNLQHLAATLCNTFEKIFEEASLV